MYIMKITLLGHTTPYSGIAGASIGISMFIYNLAVELIKKNHDVELFIRDDYKPKESWIKTVYSPKISWVLYPTFLGRKIAGASSDVYQSDYVTTGVPLISKNKRPNVVSIHDVIPFTYDKAALSNMDKIRIMWYMYNFKKIEKADAIVVLSEYSKREALKYTEIPEEKLHVVYCGVDFTKNFPLKKRLHRKIRIGYLGGLDGRKNVGLLVNSFKKIAESRDDVELHVGGMGENLEKFRRMRIRNANFYGKIEESRKNAFLNSLDIFVFPTLMEGFGLPPIEAMACGVPVVASNTTTMPELIGDSGMLVKPTEEEMIKGLSRLIESESLRKKLSQKSLKRAREFTWERCANQTLKVYDEVCRR